MQIGCGVYAVRVKGRPYLYFWHYESQGARRVQVKTYLGPADSEEARTEGLRLTDAYFRAAVRELGRSRRAAMASLRGRKA